MRWRQVLKLNPAQLICADGDLVDRYPPSPDGASNPEGQLYPGLLLPSPATAESENQVRVCPADDEAVIVICTLRRAYISLAPVEMRDDAL